MSPNRSPMKANIAPQNLAIRLIEQDMKHYRLLIGLEKLGLESAGGLDLELMELVATCMEVPASHAEDRWTDMYVRFMREAACREDFNAIVRPLAVCCYRHLSALLEYEEMCTSGSFSRLAQ